MPFTTRSIFWIFQNPDGSATFPPNALIYFTLNPATWVDSSVIIPGDIALPIGISGSGAHDLFVNASGEVATEYRLICPFLGINKVVQIAAGVPLNIEVLLFDIGVPAAPDAPILSIVVMDGSVDITVSPVAGASSYKIDRATVAGGPYTEIATGLTSFPFNDTDVEHNTTYYYIAFATNIAGDSAASPEANITTPAAAKILAQNLNFITTQSGDHLTIQ